MALLSPAEVREHVETDISDPALSRLINDAEAEIIRRYGDHTTEIEKIFGGGHFIVLSRPADTITSITEILWGVFGGTTLDLAADDYQVWPDKRRIERLSDGTNPRPIWGDVIEVDYTPVDESAQRKRVVIDLVKLALEYRGVKSEGIGDYKVTLGEYEDERRKILNRLGRMDFA